MSAERVTISCELPDGWTVRTLGNAVRRVLGVDADTLTVKRKAPPRRKEPIQQGAMIGQLVDALAGRAAGGDLDPLVALHKVSRQLDDAMTVAAIEARRAGHSWTTIAGELGVSRQAARQRWAKAAAAAGVDDDGERAGCVQCGRPLREHVQPGGVLSCQPAAP